MPDWLVVIPIIVLVLAFVFKMPIGYGMMCATILYFLIAGQDIGLVASNVLNSMYTNYIIMAAPLFVFTANVMNSGKVTDTIFKFANGLVGRFKGGTGHVNVIASLIFSGMTGSAIADASGLGIMEIEQMRKEGYDDGFSCAITAASSTIGPVFPPSIPFIVYALLSGASIGNLFLGGMIPGIMLAVALMIYVAYIAHRRNYPRAKGMGRRAFLLFSVKAIPALLTPVILLVGIYTGIMTPTEAGAVAALYALIVSFLVYRTMGVKQLIKILKNTAKTTGILGIIVSGAFAFKFIITMEHIPDIIANFMLSITDNKYLFLLIVNLVFLVLGMVLDTSAIQFVFIPMVLPLVNALGIDLVHFGVLISLNMMIGLSTPPFGMLLFITSGISQTPLKKIIKEIMPMVGVMLVVLFLITYLPEIVMFIPNLIGH